MGYHNDYRDYGSGDYCDPVSPYQRKWVSRIDQKKVVLKYRNVFVYTEKGQVCFDRNGVNRPFLTIKNLLDLDEYFPKFLKIAKQAIKRIPDLQGTGFVNEQLSYEYKKELSQDTVRAIIDCNSMNPQTKLASIFSVLRSFPVAPFKEVEAIVTRIPYFEVSFGKLWHKPTEPKEIEQMSRTPDFFNLDTILLPNFISAKSEHSYVQGLDSFTKNPDFLRALWTQHSFRTLNANVRYGDWLNSLNDDILYKFRPFISSAELKTSVRAMERLENHKISDRLYDLTPYEMRSFHFLFPVYSESVIDFLKSQLRNSDTIYYLKNAYLWDDSNFFDDESDLEDFARIVTPEQWYSLELDLENEVDRELREDLDSLSFFGATVASYCYVNYGINRLKELMEILADPTKEYNLHNARPQYDSASKAMASQTMIMKALEREYEDMPLCWTVNLLNESVSDEKEGVHV